MTDREEVIKGLEICSAGEWNSTGGRDHTDCPYYPAGYTGCTCKLLMRDALALLREQEPRVMTAEEVREDELVWIEVPQSDEIWPALLRESDWFEHPTWVMRGYAIARSFLHDGYGRDWRCWTARPTDEQREAVKWV